MQNEIVDLTYFTPSGEYVTERFIGRLNITQDGRVMISSDAGLIMIASGKWTHVTTVRPDSSAPAPQEEPTP